MPWHKHPPPYRMENGKLVPNHDPAAEEPESEPSDERSGVAS